MTLKPPETALTDPAKSTITPGTPRSVPTDTRSASQSSRTRTLDSHDLLGEQALVLIRHLGEIYRLQTTRQGKLILTK
ncbi:hemin uptake protein HemP [Limnohabitans sp. 2KL-3]|jgi:hemin uptake protein HemP|uniref:hemin uptake protein HemP n=1 Tax=Limnohabitans sp. 2KL-3 TaxID=1100700 RepID=UPI000B21E9C6|nr:hemin uptake protein HemP [Limnohabitans sp. 2KL-3]